MADTNIIAGRNIPWRLVGWSIPVLLLLLPLVAGAPWTLSDYFAMGAMFLMAGLAIELALRLSGDIVYRAAAGLAVITVFLLVWVNLAVGFLGSEQNPANAVFVAIPVVALGGAFLAHFRASGLARAMIATAVTQAAIGGIALFAGWGSAGYEGLYEFTMGSSLFTGLWLASAWLFAKSAERQKAA